jgi:hypothetical protein
MTLNIDIANRALQVMGSRTNMTPDEFLAQSSNEAIQANLIMFKLRDELTRMAPWDCVEKYAQLTYITSVPTTPENSSTGPPLWVPSLPAPPWAYEYQYPVDCLRAIAIVPQFAMQAGGVPVYPPGTVTGFSPIGWAGPAIKFDVSTDKFFMVTAATVASAGSGYAVNDLITLTQPSTTVTVKSQPGTPPVVGSFTMPVGAPAQLLVINVDGGGSLLAVSVLNQIQGETDTSFTPLGGSYFSPPTNPVAQGSTSGVGTGATFNLSMTTFPAPQRVILCNQEFAILRYNQQITDPNVLDPLFQDAWINVLAARLSFQLNGDRAMANQLLGYANNMIAEARKADGNEGITVNDVTPDFLRTRGNYGGPNWEYSPNMSYDWGSFYSPY